MKSTTLYSVIIGAAAIALSVGVVAQESPNMQPGMWHSKTTMSVEGNYPIPEQTHSNSKCMTVKEVEQGDAFLRDVQECEMVESDITRNRMTYTMRCQATDGMEMTMDGDMKFRGNSASGIITTDVESPMGPMTIRFEIEGERIGDC